MRRLPKKNSSARMSLNEAMERQTCVNANEIHPKKKPVDKKIFLEQEVWDQLANIAEFHSAVFAAMGAKEKVSRQDVISEFLEKNIKSYWDGVGGAPTTEKERLEKVRRLAETLKQSKPR